MSSKLFTKTLTSMRRARPRLEHLLSVDGRALTKLERASQRFAARRLNVRSLCGARIHVSRASLALFPRSPYLASVAISEME
jgi:hypothetical protein